MLPDYLPFASKCILRRGPLSLKNVCELIVIIIFGIQGRRHREALRKYLYPRIMEEARSTKHEVVFQVFRRRGPCGSDALSSPELTGARDAPPLISDTRWTKKRHQFIKIGGVGH